MKQTPDVSVIVPVYNGAEFLDQCVTSILAQTLDNIELILVDDGSTDESPQLCDEYGRKDPRVVVLHQKNAGVSAARNAGIAAARGRYIGFVDADDAVEETMFRRLYEEAVASQAEIVMCDAVTITAGRQPRPDTIGQLERSCTLTKADISPGILKEMAGAVWRCLYNAEMLREHQVKFPQGIKFSEDRIFNLYAMGRANRLRYIKEPLYRRLMWPGSTVHRFHADYFELAKGAAEGVRLALEEAWEDDPAYQRAYKEQFVTAAIAAINNYFYRTSPWPMGEKYRAVRRLCADELLQKTLEENDFGGIRGRWIRKKRAALLCACAMYVDRKYGR